MNRIFTTAAAAILITVATASAQTGALDQGTTATVKNAQSTLKLIDQQSANISDKAFQMNQAVGRTDDFEYQSYQLGELKDEVNRVGRELAVLEAERGSLPQWETSAVGQVLPIMHSVAMESTEAINTFNADSGRLFASNYAIETDGISRDAEKAETLLHDDIKLANARATEARLTASVDEQNAPSNQHQAQGPAE